MCEFNEVKVVDEGLNLSYFKSFYAVEKADALFREISEYTFYPLTFAVRTRKYTPARRVCGIGEPGLKYNFSGVSVNALPWTPTLLDIKADVEKVTGDCYNYVLLNLYPDGAACIGPHKDDEASLDASACIPTLSFGSSRTMMFTRPRHSVHEMDLSHGSLLLMQPPTNQHWKHGIPPQQSVKNHRISLTFRRLVQKEEPPAKKQRTSDIIPDNDWLAQHILNSVCVPVNSSIEELKRWGLQTNSYVCVVLKNSELFVKFGDNNLQSEVCMCAATWWEFTTKLHNHNFHYKDASFIANNKLIVLNNSQYGCTVQEIYNRHNMFKLGEQAVVMSDEEFSSLRDLHEEVTNLLKESMFNRSLPALIRQSPAIESMELQEEAAQAKMWECVKTECENTINIYFKCAGCKVSHPSQRRHECLNVYTFEKFKELGENVLLCINLKSLSNSILKYITKDYFNTSVENLNYEKCIQLSANM